MLHQRSNSEFELNLDSNCQEEIDTCILAPFKYRLISAYNNKLSVFPHRGIQCENLTALNLSCNYIDSIPAVIAKLMH